MFKEDNVVIGFFRKEMNWDCPGIFLSTTSTSCWSIKTSKSTDVFVEGDEAGGEKDFVLNCLLDEDDDDVELELDDDDDEAEERDDDSLVLNCIFNSVNFFNWGFELDDDMVLVGKSWVFFCKDGSLVFKKILNCKELFFNKNRPFCLIYETKKYPIKICDILRCFSWGQRFILLSHRKPYYFSEAIGFFIVISLAITKNLY